MDPGLFNFSNSGPIVSATFTSPGTYVINLQVYDGLEYGNANVTIKVNAPPTVNAGSDQIVDSTVASAVLHGSASDSDGLPVGTLIYG